MACSFFDSPSPWRHMGRMHGLSLHCATVVHMHFLCSLRLLMLLLFVVQCRLVPTERHIIHDINTLGGNFTMDGISSKSELAQKQNKKSYKWEVLHHNGWPQTAVQSVLPCRGSNAGSGWLQYNELYSLPPSFRTSLVPARKMQCSSTTPISVRHIPWWHDEKL